MRPQVVRAHMAHLPRRGVANHLRVGLEARDAQQAVVIRWLLRRRNPQPPMIRIEVGCRGGFLRRLARRELVPARIHPDGDLQSLGLLVRWLIFGLLRFRPRCPQQPD